MDMLTSFQGVVKSCVWCKEHTRLKDGKPYCLKCCNRMFQECVRCHFPYPDAKYFSEHDSRCNSCQKKYMKEKERRLVKKRSMEAQSTSCQPSIEKHLTEKRKPKMADATNKPTTSYQVSDDDDDDDNDEEKEQVITISPKRRKIHIIIT